jgi:hypothetical protein
MRRSSLVVLLVAGALLVPVAVFASHQFNDVPDSHIFHTGISWMKDNNITVGCNPPANTNYCPDDNVTRGQMATFMKRLAENKVVDAATAVNADMLDGLDSTAFGQATGISSNDQLEGLGTTPNLGVGETVIETLNANAPANGAFVIMFSAALRSDQSVGTGEVLVYGQVAVDGTDVPGSFSSEVLDDEVTFFFEQGTVSSQVVVPVTSGDHTVDLKITINGETAGDTASVWGSSLVVFWVPSGSYATSAAPAGEGSPSPTQP